MRAIGFVVLLAAAVPASAEGPRTVAVTGKASVQVAPNEARIQYAFIDEARVPAGGPRPAKDLVPRLVERNARRVKQALEYLKGLVGRDGTVEALPSVHRQYEYNGKTGKQELVGYRATTQVQVVLQGAGAIAERLARFFDTGQLEADEVSEPSMGLTEQTRAAAERDAAKAAVDDALAAAAAQLEPGEQLGAALQRGERSEAVPVFKSFAARAMAAPSEADGQAVVETGKITVQTAIHFVFEVLGAPARLKR